MEGLTVKTSAKEYSVSPLAQGPSRNTLSFLFASDILILFKFSIASYIICYFLPSPLFPPSHLSFLFSCSVVEIKKAVLPQLRVRENGGSHASLRGLGPGPWQGRACSRAPARPGGVLRSRLCPSGSSLGPGSGHSSPSGSSLSPRRLSPSSSLLHRCLLSLLLVTPSPGCPQGSPSSPHASGPFVHVRFPITLRRQTSNTLLHFWPLDIMFLKSNSISFPLQTASL